MSFLLMSLAAGVARAAPPETLATQGKGAGEVEAPVGTAVHQASGDLYVADFNNGRIDKFDSEGDFLLAWGFGVRDGLSAELQTCGPTATPPQERCFGPNFTSNHDPGNISPVAVAADQSTGDVYVADSDRRRISKFTSAGEFLFLTGGDVITNGANGTGTVASGSTLVTAVSTTSKVFKVGQAITGTGIEPGTTIASVGPGTITLSQPAGPAATGAATAISAPEGANNVPSNERQTVRLGANTTGGTFTLTYSTPNPSSSSATATAIPFNATAAELEAKLAGLSNIGAGNVAVSGSAGGPWTVEFTGARYADTDVNQMTANGGGLTVSSGAKQVAISSEKAGEVCAVAAECQAATSGTAPNEFTSPRSLAVTASGVVWVGDTNRLKSFDSTGTPGAEIELPGAGHTTTLATNSEGDFYLKSQDLPGIRKLEAGTGAELEVLDAGGFPKTVTVDGADRILIGDCAASTATCPNYRFMVFDPTGAQISQFGLGQVIGAPGLRVSGVIGSNAIAVDDSAGTLYAASSSPTESAVQRFSIPEPGPLIEDQRAEDISPTTATLAASLNPEGNETTYHFEYGTDESYGESTPATVLPGTGFDAETVEAPISELEPGTTYHFRLVASNECEPAVQCENAGPDTTFTTLPAVVIEAQWATDVAATSANLHAKIDPLGVAGSWWLEYGTSPCSEGGCEQTAKAALPATFGAITVGVTLTGLEPGTTYHYLFAAEDERDGVIHTVEGTDRSFTTQPGALGFALPDDRAWEMVTPPNKFGGALWAPQEGQLQAAVDGNAVAYVTKGSIEAHPDGSRPPEEGSAMSRRHVSGWDSDDLAPPNGSFVQVTVGYGLVYKLFNPDLSGALLHPRAAEPLSPEASERTPYLRNNTEPPTYTPLVTGKEGFANVPASTEFGEDAGNPAQSAVRIMGATPDLSRVLIRSQVPLVDGAAVFSLYRRTLGVPPAQQLRAVSVLPAGGPPIAGVPGSKQGSVRHALSDDGSRVFWGAASGGNPPTALYLRDMDREESVRLDIVQPGAFGTGASAPVFQGADSGGTVAFFTDTRNLTVDASEGGRDLYRCAVTLEAGELACDLTNVTGQTASPTEDADVQGLVAGMGDDATRVYFVAKGVLASNEGAAIDPASGEREVAEPGQNNLYVWHEGEGLRFIARLAALDAHDWGQHPDPTGGFEASKQSAAASPSGRYLAFMSERSLTGYDNREASSAQPAQEVFRYDAVADELICASCNPAGSRPSGLFGEGTTFFDPQALWTRLWDGRPLAAVLPDATVLDETQISGISLYRPRAVHDNGRLFFNAADSLVPADSNGDWDVYQYEPTGTGSCGATSADAGTAISAGGCVSLLSSGTAEGEAAFLDASVGGDDVFFYTPAQLSVTDEDREVDVYDARVGGTAATLTPRAECLGEACQPAAGAPDFPAPASAFFAGPGNPGQDRDCGAAGRSAAKLSRRAKRLRGNARRARRAGKPGLAKKRGRKAGRLAKHAKQKSQSAKRCRRAERRAGR